MDAEKTIFAPYVDQAVAESDFDNQIWQRCQPIRLFFCGQANLRRSRGTLRPGSAGPTKRCMCALPVHSRNRW